MGRRGCPPEFRRKVGGPGRGGPLSRRPRQGRGSGNSRSPPGVGKTASAVTWYFGSQSAEQAKQFFGMVHQAFPDLHAEVHDVIAEGELVAARVTYTGTHQGEFVGIPATGKQTTTNGVDLFRI
jgi:SnoaL-like polyketide cyclase